MKKSIILCVISMILMIFLLTGCNSFSGNDNGKVKITASLFPQYDFARQIAGDKADVQLLLLPGTESHTYEPKPADLAEIYDSNIFVYTGKYMEPWAQRVIESVKNDKLVVVDASQGITLVKDEDEESGYDPHIWLDPDHSIQMVDNILQALCKIDQANASYYIDNADKYKQELKKLDEDMATVVRESKRKVLVFGGRFAYHYFIDHYGLEYKAVYDTCSAEGEPSIKRVGDIIDFIEKNNIPCIYYEELAEPKTARMIAEQTHTEPLLFSTAHNVTKDELDKNITYIDIMRQNLKNLQKGLN